MSKTRKNLLKRNQLSRNLIVHIIIVTLILGICMSFLFMLSLKEKIALFSWIVLYLLASIMIIEIIYFIRKTLKSVIEIERTIEELQNSTDMEGVTNDNLELEKSNFSLIERIQILLQRESAANILKKQAEIEALQNQINPHFLYNTLETIRGQAICFGAMEIAETTKALADIFRYNISKKGAMILLPEELANIDAYMKIQRIRFNDKFELQKKIEPEVLNLKIPKLLIQPIVENALKHGLEMKRGKGLISICAFSTEDTLIISVSDDGLGMSIEKLEELNKRLSNSNQFEIVKESSKNVGLVNINDRIKMIYGVKYGIDVKSVKDVGTKVTLSLGILN